MSDFDLRKFLAEQKAAKVETVKEEEAVQKENKVAEAAKETNFSSDEIKSVSFPNGLSVTVGEEHPEEDGTVIGIEKGENGYIIMFQDGSEGGGYHVDFDGEFLDEDDFIEEAVEETYHEGEDTMEEGDVTESVLAGIAALVGGTVGLGKLLDYLKSKGFELTDPNGKSVLDTTIRGLKKEEETHEGEEMDEEVSEEEIQENTFKSSIKDILNS